MRERERERSRSTRLSFLQVLFPLPSSSFSYDTRTVLLSPGSGAYRCAGRGGGLVARDAPPQLPGLAAPPASPGPFARPAPPAAPTERAELARVDGPREAFPVAPAGDAAQ